MKFASPTAEPIHVALTNGRTAVITAEGTELDREFHREAISRGAEPMDPAAGQSLKLQVMDRQLAIRDAMTAMRVGANKEDFTKDGKPDLRKLNGRAGFPVTREEADLVWAEITADA